MFIDVCVKKDESINPQLICHSVVVTAKEDLRVALNDCVMKCESLANVLSALLARYYGPVQTLIITVLFVIRAYCSVPV